MELENVRKKYEWELLDDLLHSYLRDQNRSYFYSLEAAEAKLISVINDQWKVEYFNNLFNTDTLLMSK